MAKKNLSPLFSVLTGTLGLTQPLIAAAIGVASLTVSRWQRGGKGGTDPSDRDEDVLRALETLANHPEVDQGKLRAFLKDPLESLPTEGLVEALRLSPLERASIRLVASRLGAQGIEVVGAVGAKKLGELFISKSSEPVSEGDESSRKGEEEHGQLQR